jgi:hypothetical protein
MLRHIIFLMTTVGFYTLNPFGLTFAGDSTTNQPTKASIAQLLKNKEQLNSKRVEVTGYYVSLFEYSYLMEDEQSGSKDKIWVDPFDFAPGSAVKIAPVERGWVRIIGVFESREGQSYGHLGMCSAQVTRLELLQKIPNPSTTNVPSHSPKSGKGKGVNPSARTALVQP